jgi:hypothetical protein
MGSARRNASRLAAVGLCVALAGCGKSESRTAGGSANTRAEKARKDAEALALGGVTGGAAAQARAEPASVRHNAGLDGGLLPFPKAQPPSMPPAAPTARAAPAPAAGPPAPKSTPRSGWMIRERVASKNPYPTEAEAEEDALAAARDLVERKLAELDPPLKYKPSPGEVRAEFVRKDSRVVRPPSAAEKEALALYDRYVHTDGLAYVEYDVEVTADQVRELRSQERVSTGVRVMGVLIAVALAGFLFLRADDWTKGYLTRWLALAAVTLGGGVAAALIFV